jgi:hypothetical protein
MALLLVLGIRTSVGESAFVGKSDVFWAAWRIPFLLSAVLLAVSIWIRLRLNESPVFQKMKAEGKGSKRPLTEAFGNWANLKIAILALFGATAGEAVIWYGGQFYALFFLTQTLKVPAVNAQIMIAIGLLLGTPFFIVFGWLSDKIGRKPIILAGFALGVITYFPIFQGITHFANPKLEAALASAPVTVVADPSECSFQFNPVGTAKFTSSCDIAKSALVARSVNYQNVEAPKGTKAVVKVGDQTIATDTPNFAQVLGQAITAHGYPASANPADINYVMTVILLTILVIYGHLGLRADRRLAGGALPDPDPLQRIVTALPHRQRMVWRVPAGDGVRHRCSDGQHLFRSLVSDRGRGGELRRRPHFPARDQGSRHHPNVIGR